MAPLTVSADIDDRGPADEAVGIVVLAHLVGHIVFAANLVCYCCANGTQEGVVEAGGVGTGNEGMREGNGWRCEGGEWIEV